MAAWDQAPIEGAPQKKQPAGQSPAWAAAPVDAAPRVKPEKRVLEVYNPTDENSFLDNVKIGAGKAVSDTGLGLGQLARSLLPAGAADAVGLPTQADVDDAARRDKPLMETGGGMTGNVLGQIAQMFVPGTFVSKVAPIKNATAAVTTALPRLAPYIGASAQGAAFEAAQPVVTGDTRSGNAITGALFGAGGQGAADVGKAVLTRSLAQGAQQAAANATRDATLTAGRDAGYVVTPSQAGAGGLVNRVLEALSGKVKTQQAASVKNAEVTNDLAKQALGLPKDKPITLNDLNAIRAREGAAYDAVGSSGTITPGQSYTDALDAIVAPYVKASKSFPNSKPNPIIDEIQSLRSASFDADSAIAKIKTLRADADAAYGSGNKELGKSLKAGAGALEDAIEAHLTATGAPAGLLDAFRNARQTIAKTYTVQGALNQATGDVSARKLGAQVAKGRPLSGELRTAGEFANSFPKAVQDGVDVPAWSVMDLGASMLGAPGVGALVAGRPLARGLVTNPTYQRLMVNPQYGPGPVARTALPALDTELAKKFLTVSGSTATRGDPP